MRLVVRMEVLLSRLVSSVAEMVVLLENEKSAVLDRCTVSRGVTMCLQNDEDFSFRKIVGLTPPVVRGVSKVPKN